MTTDKESAPQVEAQNASGNGKQNLPPATADHADRTIWFSSPNDPLSWSVDTEDGVVTFATPEDAKRAEALYMDLRRELAAANAENVLLRSIEGYDTEQCLSCGGDGGHTEGCNGTTAVMLISAKYEAERKAREKAEQTAALHLRLIKEICEEWNEGCDEACDSISHTDTCKAVHIAEAKRAFKERADAADRVAKEMEHRWKLAERLGGRPKPTLSPEDIGIPHLREE